MSGFKLKDGTASTQALAEDVDPTSLSAFAVVKDGKWFERGRMGWFATVSGEKDPETWDAMFANLIKDLPPETPLTIVDCHI